MGDRHGHYGCLERMRRDATDDEQVGNAASPRGLERGIAMVIPVGRGELDFRGVVVRRLVVFTKRTRHHTSRGDVQPEHSEQAGTRTVQQGTDSDHLWKTSSPNVRELT